MSWIDAIIEFGGRFGIPALIILGVGYGAWLAIPVIWTEIVGWLREYKELTRQEADRRLRLLNLQIEASEKQAKNVLLSMRTLSSMRKELKAMRMELKAMRMELEAMRRLHNSSHEVSRAMERIISQLAQAAIDNAH